MSIIVTPDALFEKIVPDNEEPFENAVKANAKMVFGEGRHYLDCKRRIGAKGKKVSIPDAYLIDLKGNQPRLFLVENEISQHDLFEHIGVQLLRFAHSYSLAGSTVIKDILFEEISKAPDIEKACVKYAKESGFRNLDHLIDALAKTPFQVVVIIDEDTADLHSVVKHFEFPVEIIEFISYKDKSGKEAYTFEPFLQDVGETIGEVGRTPTDISELDTIAVPAQDEGFNETFLGENRWYQIRIHSSMKSQIKYIAAYRVSPISAITHVAPVNKIIPWENTGKYCLEFAEPAHEISPIKLEEHERGKAPQGPRYTSMGKLKKAKTLSEVF